MRVSEPTNSFLVRLEGLTRKFEQGLERIQEYEKEVDAKKEIFIEAIKIRDARIAELEGLVDELIEEGAWGAELAINIGALSGDDQYKLAKKRYDKWDALVKGWEERER